MTRPQFPPRRHTPLDAAGQQRAAARLRQLANDVEAASEASRGGVLLRLLRLAQVLLRRHRSGGEP